MGDLGGVHVTGGAAGIAAQLEDLEVMARLLGSGGRDLLVLSMAGHQVAQDGDLVASALVAPGTAAHVEATLLAALDGPDGLTMTAARLSTRAADVAAAVLRYRAADLLEGELVELRRWLQGTVTAAALPVLVPAALGFGGGWATGAAAGGGEPATTLERLLVGHPGLVDELAGSTPGLISFAPSLMLGPGLLDSTDAALRATTGRTLVPRDLEQAASLLGLLYPPARATVRRVTTDRSLETAAPPATLVDLLTGLERCDRLAVRDQQGYMDVRRVRTGAGGPVRTSWIVDVPGTKDWQVDPRHRPYVNDLTTNLATLAGDETARVQGIGRALEIAGARPGEPVMLVGHSQGGLVALRAAQEWSRTGRFTVTHVVTAGSPVGSIEVPDTVQVLSLENRHDIVPHLDSRPNPDRPHWTTVEFDVPLDDIGANHRLNTVYVPAADALTSDGDAAPASVRAWLESAESFLARDGEVVTVETSVYDVRNEQ